MLKVSRNVSFGLSPKELQTLINNNSQNETQKGRIGVILDVGKELNENGDKYTPEIKAKLHRLNQEIAYDIFKTNGTQGIDQQIDAMQLPGSEEDKRAFKENRKKAFKESDYVSAQRMIDYTLFLVGISLSNLFEDNDTTPAKMVRDATKVMGLAVQGQIEDPEARKLLDNVYCSRDKIANSAARWEA